MCACVSIALSCWRARHAAPCVAYPTNRPPPHPPTHAHTHRSDFQTADSSFATSAGGTLYKVSRGRATTDPSYATYVSTGSVGAGVFDPSSGNVVGGESLNANMGYWDRGTISAPNLGTIEIGEGGGKAG